MRIMIWSNSPYAHTGYGRQVNNLLPHLHSMGHKVAVVANYGLAGARINYKGIPIYPLREKRHNADVLTSYIDHFGADIIMSLYDVWSLPKDAKQLMNGIPWIGMVPVDGAPVSKPMIQRIKEMDYVISYSKFGHDELKKVGINSHYIPHGVDTTIFAPSKISKRELRRKVGLPEDVFLITTVAANKGFPPRKSWPELLAGYKLFVEKYPESFLYLHTTKEPLGSGNDGIYFPYLIKNVLRTGIPEGKVGFPDDHLLHNGVSDEGMAKLYQASDVMLLPSRGEGFGLPVLEAQLCGCPVITTNCSAMPELTVNGVSLEPLQPQWLPQLGYYWHIPSIPLIADGLAEIFHQSETTRKKNREAGLELAQEYSFSQTFHKYWVPFWEHVEETIW